MVWRAAFVVMIVVRFKLVPKKYELIVFSLLMSGFMSLIMSGVISFINMGLVDNFLEVWIIAFINAYVIAFPAVLIILPIVRKIVFRLVKNI